MSRQDDIRLVEENISVRLNPFIYAFSTNTIPRYLKVGDTLRGVDIRIAEWQKTISQKLHSESVKLTEEFRKKAMLSDEIYFRDYSVHEYLESIGKHRIADPEIRKLYSQEFFADTSVADIQSAIQSITDDFNSGELAKRYSYYSVKENRSATVHGANDKKWTLRPNQETVVETFKRKSDKSELLMYAVMRFGKSFTAMSCALAAKARKVLIVSAKADVAGEWQKTVETPECFKDYTFLTDIDLANGTLISDILSQTDKNCVALFLTLQNVSGKTSDGKNIKSRLEQIFKTEFDLIIVDETHYGAWANSYGEPLKDADDDIIKEERKDYINFGKQVARLHGKQKLHLSGTPYNLLYDNKFTADNIIATCQFKDILHDKEKWDGDHFDDIENGVENPNTGKPYQEFDNPYFGFPKMLRFAFNLPLDTRQRLEKAKYNWTLNDLFETTVTNDVATFVHEKSVLDLLKAVDGKKEVDGILGFLDIPKIKDNEVCKHMVFVLPRKYACDAMENLLLSHADEFSNLDKYEVLNITGHTLTTELDSVDKIKSKVSELEKGGKKSITLTVYKMLTGVTVKEWDTMFMLKNTRSAQEYDQAAFRIQNQYVEEYYSADGDVIKIDKKPQTILVDFDPIRMFTLQGLSSRIVEHVKTDDATLSESIKQELDYFPIIAYNAEKLVKVAPNDLIELITQYNNNKSIVDSVQSVVLDRELLSDESILQYIKNQSPTSAKNTLDTQAHKSNDTSDVDITEDPSGESTSNNGAETNNGGNQDTDNDTADKDLEKKYRMCIARLSFYAFLTKSNIDGLQDIIDSLKKDCELYDNNKRIFSNLQLNYTFIVGLKTHLSRYFALNVDDALKRANLLSNDNKLLPEERALNAIKNFNRFSESEVVTPNSICDEMVGCIGKEKLIEIIHRGDKILDIASKAGEFAFAVFKLLKDDIDKDKLQNAIYSIPTSGTAYEFTRRIYEVLGLNIDNIAIPRNFTSYNLLDVKRMVKKKEEIDYVKIKLLLTQNKKFSEITLDDIVDEGATDMINFGAVVGNPPYQVENKNNNRKPPIFHIFYDIAFALSSRASLITPARFLFNAGQTPKEWNHKMLTDEHIKVIKHYPSAELVFESVDIKGGVAILLRDEASNFGKIGMFISNKTIFDIVHKVQDEEFMPLSSIVYSKSACGLSDQLYAEHPELKSRLTDGNENIIDANIFEKMPEIFEDAPLSIPYIKILGRYNDKRVYKYIKRQYIKDSPNLHKYKVLITGVNGTGEFGECLSDLELGEIDVAYTQTFMSIGAFNSKIEANNCIKYIKSKFLRLLLGTLKVTHNNAKKCWANIPIQDFTENSDIDWNRSIPEIDMQLYVKYSLTVEEIQFVESTIKSME